MASSVNTIRAGRHSEVHEGKSPVAEGWLQIPALPLQDMVIGSALTLAGQVDERRKAILDERCKSLTRG